MRYYLVGQVVAGFAFLAMGCGTGELIFGGGSDDTPGDDTPGDDTPGDDTPGDDTPGDDTPGDDTPTDSDGDDTTPPPVDGGVGPGVGDGPAVERGETFFGTVERFNRYYTDPSYTPSATIFVSPTGGGNGSSAGSPTTLEAAFEDAEPGTMIRMAAGTYDDTCVEWDETQGGTYDAPKVIVGERDGSGGIAVTINCCGSGRATCINLEGANYVAVDSVEVVGGQYGVRAVGNNGTAADQHQVGVAILRSHGHDQSRDPFFSGQSSWMVVEAVEAHGAGSQDGHGIYLSNGSDWLIVRDNEVYDNQNAQIQINADPFVGCEGEGFDFDDPECDAVAGTSATGGRGASDYCLVERNFVHHGTASGPNFTSMRNSVVRNNIFAFEDSHNTSFWQETNNPRLGSSSNRVLHNLFIIANGGHAVQFIEGSGNNVISHNVFVATGDGLLVEVANATGNQFDLNAFVNGSFDGFNPLSGDITEAALDESWFRAWSTALGHDPTIFRPTAAAPWAAAGPRLDDAPADMLGVERKNPTSLGPIETP